MNRRFSIITIVISAVVGALATLAFLTLAMPISAIAPAQPLAGAPNLITYQGHLTESSGEPINGNRTLKFGIYSAKFDGTLIWEEPHTAGTVTNGYFTVLLGSITPLSASTLGNTSPWLQVSVYTSGVYNDLPRQQLTAAPFALQAQEAANADTLDGQHASAFASASTSGCRVIATISQTIPPGTPLTALLFDTATIDTNGDCWTAANRTRLYAKTAGYYMAGGAVAFYNGQVDPARRIFVGVRLNGNVYLQSNDLHTSSNVAACPSVATGMFHMDANDYIEIAVWHNFDSARNTYTEPLSTGFQNLANGWLMKIN